eukprot:4404902-Alexandrium_andersonii.AAC.1
MHEACLRARKDHQGPVAGRPSRGPECALTPERPEAEGANLHACAECREGTVGLAAEGTAQWPGPGH